MIVRAFVVSALAALSPGAAAPPQMSLHQRIVMQHDAAHDPDAEAELRNAEALAAEAEADRALSVEDRAMVAANTGYALAYLRRHAEALRAIDAAVAMLASAGRGDTQLAAEMMMNAASEAGDAGDRDDADRRFNAVLRLQSRLLGPDSDDVGTTMAAIGYNAMRQGRLDYAIENVKGALARMKPSPSTRATFIANYATLSTALNEAGRAEESLAAARIGAMLAQRDLPPNHVGVGVTLANLAASLNGAGRYAEAETVARRAMEIDVRYRGKTDLGIASVLNTLAFSLAAQGRAVEAETLYLAGADLYDVARDTVAPRTPASLLLNAADLARARGDETAADAHIARAEAYLATPSKTDGHLRARSAQARALGLLIAGHDTQAEQLADAAVQGFSDLPTVQPQRAEAELLRSLAQVRAGHARAAYDGTRALAGAMETVLLDSTAARGELLNLGPVYARGFRRLAIIALAAGENEQAIRAIQLANLSELAITDGAVAARAAAGDAATAALVRTLQDLGTARQRLEKERSFALGKSAAEVTRLEALMAANDRDRAATLEAIDLRFPAFRALSRPAIADLSTIQRSLGTRDALLLPVSADDGGAAVLVTARAMTWAPTALDTASLNAAVTRLRASLEDEGTAAGFPAADAYRLYRAVLPQPLRAALPRQAVLRLFGGGELGRIPLGLLWTAPPHRADLGTPDFAAAPWLIRRHGVEVVANLGAQPEVQTAAASASFAGIGAPHLGDERPGDAAVRAVVRGGLAGATLASLPSLPGAARELGAIRTALHPAQSLMLTGDDATEARVKAADLSGYRVVVFATHGFVGGGTLDEPALVLTPPATPTALDDGLLTASEASVLRLDADWIVLSGCDSAGAGAAGAPVYSGLARAFFQAGGRALLVSMWRLRDDIAARLTVATLSAGTASGKAEALRRAQLSLIRDRHAGTANPALWAPFTLLER